VDEEKKSESSWEEAERLGPYQLHEQVPQDDHSHGEFYRATHVTTGAPALVRKPAAKEEEGAVPLDLRVRIISSASPAYDAMEVEQTSRSVAPDRQSVESMVSTLEDVHKAVGRMAHASSASEEPRPRQHLGLVKLVGAAAACALAFTVGRHAPVSPSPSGPEPVARAGPAPMSHEVPTDTAVPFTGNSSPRGAVDGGPPLAHPFPRKPYKGQKRPPCTPRVEVEIMGACWVPHMLKAPCPEELYEYQGQCYTTSMLPQPLPQSLGQ
jgi:hypothetical protein